MNTPVPAAQRAVSIDAVRGLAILGILFVNIQYFAMGVDLNPPNPNDTDRLLRALVAIFAESKFISIFSMLFGAGIVLMDQSARRRGEKWTVRYITRTAVLFALGFLHAYLLWYGDILFTYAIIGFVVFWLRGLSPKLLVAIGSAVFVLGLAVTGWLALFDGGEVFPPGVEFDAARAGFVSRVALYALVALLYQTLIFVIMSAWFVTGLMLVGMGLCKLGFFQGAAPTRWYTATIAAACIIALPAIALAFQSRPDGFGTSIAWAYVNMGLAPVVALAYCSALILICTRRKPGFVPNALAAVGRTALTNYLAQSVICVIIFYQLGQIGRLNDAAVHAITLAIFAAQLIASTLWLKAFRTGPIEWAWRSITYGKFQPLIKRPVPQAPQAM